jgi:hypothetical protein
MNRLYQFLLAVWVLTAPGCSFFTSPDEARFGELEINIRFAGANNSAAADDANDPQLSRAGAALAPQAITRIVVLVISPGKFETPTNRQPQERVVVRRDFDVRGANRLQPVIQVPLEDPEENCFIVQVQAFDGATPLYFGSSGENTPLCFNARNRRAAANILLEPNAFSLDLSNIIQPSGSRIVELSGYVQDTTVKAIEISMGTVVVKFPVIGFNPFSNPVLLFGDTTVLKVNALQDNGASHGVARRLMIYNGQRADMIVALVWDQPINLDLAISTPPFSQIITGDNPSDSIDVRGKIVKEDADGFGPEVYEWRNSLGLQGAFRVSVRRTQLGGSVGGRVYVFLREGQKELQRLLPPVAFQFNPQSRDTLVATISWPN